MHKIVSTIHGLRVCVAAWCWLAAASLVACSFDDGGFGEVTSPLVGGSGGVDVGGAGDGIDNPGGGGGSVPAGGAGGMAGVTGRAGGTTAGGGTGGDDAGGRGGVAAAGGTIGVGGTTMRGGTSGAPMAGGSSGRTLNESATAGKIDCGMQTCDLEKTYCCATGEKAACIALNKSCTAQGGSPSSCDGAEDCPDQRLCCARPTEGGHHAICAEALFCAGQDLRLLCHNGEQCPDKQQCCETNFGATSVGTCRANCS